MGMVGTLGCVPGVEFVAPGTEPVARKCTFYDFFDYSSLFEPVLAAVNVSGEYICAEGVVDRAT